MKYKDETTALKQISEILSRTTKTLDSIFDYTWIRILVENPLFFNIFSEFKIKQKGVAVRFITTINHENLSYCTKLMKFVELRHIDEIIGYLGISDKKYFFYVQPLFGQENKVKEENRNNLQLNFIFLSNQTFTQMQSILFEKLWELSIPANEKIAEVKRMMFDKSLLNTNINDLDIIKQVITKVIHSANKEVLLFFPTINSFWLIEESNRLIELLVDILDRYVKVKVIIHINSGDSNIKEKIDQKIKESSKILGTYVYYSTKKIDTKTILLISDQAISLTISLKDYDNNTKRDTIETAVISNEELNISTFLSFFDSLWIRTEIEKQNILKQTYYKIFKEPQLRDENYRRKWIFENIDKDS
jgi:hypothetical protein